LSGFTYKTRKFNIHFVRFLIKHYFVSKIFNVRNFLCIIPFTRDNFGLLQMEEGFFFALTNIKNATKTGDGKLQELH